MKILSIVWHQFLPAHFGGQQTIAAFNNELGKHVEVICLCSYNNIPNGNETYQVVPTLPVNKLQFLNPITWYKIYLLAKKKQITHVIIEHPYHAIAAWFLKKYLTIHVIHSSHNIEYLRFKQLGKFYWKTLYAVEKWVCTFASLNLFVTEQDAHHCIENFGINPNKCFVLPHTITQKNSSHKLKVQQQIKKQLSIAKENKIFLFNGTLDYAPNAEAVQNIATKLIPLLQQTKQPFTFIITGRIENANYKNLYQLANNNLLILGAVDNISDYFLAADVYINAVNKGGGVQTKTLEALSYNLNVVCFNTMLNGVAMYTCSNKIFTAPENNWNEMASQTIAALEKSEPTPEIFFNHYSYASYFTNFIEKIKRS